MYRLAFFFLFLRITCCYAQPAFFNNSFKLSYGLFSPEIKRFGDALFPVVQEKVNKPVHLFSLALEHGRSSDKNVTGEMGFIYFFNQKISADTLKINWFANTAYLIWKYDVLRKNRILDFYVGAGPMIGSQRIILRDNGKIYFYRNFNAAVIPQIDLQLNFGKRFSLGYNVIYVFDLTGGQWKSLKGNYVFGSSDFSGFLMRAGIGLAL